MGVTSAPGTGPPVNIAPPSAPGLLRGAERRGAGGPGGALCRRAYGPVPARYGPARARARIGGGFLTVSDLDFYDAGKVQYLRLGASATGPWSWTRSETIFGLTREPEAVACQSVTQCVDPSMLSDLATTGRRFRAGADHRMMIGWHVDCHGCVREHVRVTYDVELQDIIALHRGLNLPM
jgi:hypothetical protein